MTRPRRLFVTGASSGLGRGLAEHYAREGAHLGLVARREPLLRELEKEWGERGARVEVYVGDVSDTAFMARTALDFLETAGGVDLVVANAGVGIANRVLEGEAAEIAWLMGINVVGVTNTVIPFVPHLVKQGSGVLCAVSSAAGHQPLPGRAAYSASKAAVITFMSALRMDLAGTGVHAMAICPGFVHTPLTEDTPEMPFAIGADEAVRHMARAIEAKKKTFTFPWQIAVFNEVMKRLPEGALRKVAPAPRSKTSTPSR